MAKSGEPVGVEGDVALLLRPPPPPPSMDEAIPDREEEGPSVKEKQQRRGADGGALAALRGRANISSARTTEINSYVSAGSSRSSSRD